MSQRKSFSFFQRKSKPDIPKSPNISASVAMKIIDKEQELESSWDLKTIHELISLYTAMIEHYEQNNNPKFSDYQDRMHKMLKKPQVISALQHANCKPDLKIQKKSQNPFLPMKPPMHPKADKENMPNPVILERRSLVESTKNPFSKQLSKTISQTTTNRNAGIVIERQNKTSKETANKAAADFKSQDLSLQRRIASRKAIQLTKSMTQSLNMSEQSQVTYESSEEESCTRFSFLVDEHDTVSTFEKKLEEIIENSFQERTAKISEIKFKYESQISEISGMGSLQEMILSQMRKSMKEEIDSAVKECDEKRKEEIQRLKEQMSR